MIHELFDHPHIPDEKPARKERQPGELPDDTGNVWAALWGIHPEGGGPFGGRDNALTKFIGFLRAKSIPIEGALQMAQNWNLLHLDPPLDSQEVSMKVATAWVQWLEGGHEDDTPESVTAEVKKPKLVFMNWQAFKVAAAQAKDTEWIVRNLIVSGGMHFLIAPAGGGKSWLAADLARAASYGGKWIGCMDVKKCNVLYVNEEMGTGRFFERFQLLEPDDIETLHVINNNYVKLDNPAHLAQIVQYVTEHQIEIVILDTFVRVHGYDENSNSEMAKLYEKMKRINECGAAVLALHHMKKGIHVGPVQHEAMRGAGEIAAQADCVMSVENRDGLYTLKTAKQRHIGEEDFIEVKYKIQSEGASVALVELRPGALEYRADVSLDDQILAVLETNPGLTGTAISKEINRRTETVIARLAAMETSNLVYFSYNKKAKCFYKKGLV